jgi:hypothetical protein
MMGPLSTGPCSTRFSPGRADRGAIYSQEQSGSRHPVRLLPSITAWFRPLPDALAAARCQG